MTTVKAILFGIAAFLAIAALAPHPTMKGEGVTVALMAAAVGVLVAFALGLPTS
jgi:ABC-type branched-subunit amino acid transport system permease subunit